MIETTQVKKYKTNWQPISIKIAIEYLFYFGYI